MREEKEQLRGLCGTSQTEETQEEMGPRWNSQKAHSALPATGGLQAPGS